MLLENFADDVKTDMKAVSNADPYLFITADWSEVLLSEALRSF